MVLVALLLLGGLPAGQDPGARADAARDADRLDEAVVLYRKALAARPNWAEGWWSLGTILYDRDQYSEASVALRKAAALDPKSGNALVMLGLCEAKLGRSKAALADIERGRRLGGGNDPRLRPATLFTQGKLLLELGHFGRAQEVLGELARDGVEQEELTAALGSAVLGVKANATNHDLVIRAGRAEQLAARKDVDQAMREYERLAADFPKTRNVQFAYGRFLLANHMNDRAVEAFEREIANSPDHLLARLGIAGIRASTDPDAGLPHVRKALEISPNLPEAHYLLGLLLLNKGEAKPAVPELEIARRGMPEDARVYFQLARAYAELDRKQEAARARAEFIRLDKRDAAAAR